ITVVMQERTNPSEEIVLRGIDVCGTREQDDAMFQQTVVRRVRYEQPVADRQPWLVAHGALPPDGEPGLFSGRVVEELGEAAVRQPQRKGGLGAALTGFLRKLLNVGVVHVAREVGRESFPGPGGPGE